MFPPGFNFLTAFNRVDDIKLWKSTVDGYICRTDNTLSPFTPSTALSKFLGRDVHLVCKGPRQRSCPTTYAFPYLNASAVYQDAFPLLITSNESLDALQEKVR